MELFFSLVFSVNSSLEIFLPTPLPSRVIFLCSTKVIKCSKPERAVCKNVDLNLTADQLKFRAKVNICKMVRKTELKSKSIQYLIIAPSISCHILLILI